MRSARIKLECQAQLEAAGEIRRTAIDVPKELFTLSCCLRTLKKSSIGRRSLQMRAMAWAGHCANTILPEFQGLKAGDEIPIGGGPGWPVSSLEPNKSLVLDIRQPGVHINWSWLLIPVGENTTRLVLRIRGRLDIKLSTVPIIALLDPGEFTMVRKMLTGIKRRVEGTPGTPMQELIELILWCAVVLFGLVAFFAALFKRA